MSHQQADVLSSRKEFQEELCSYYRDTVTDIDMVRGFCNKSSKWMLQRETELDVMRDIQERADKISPKFSSVTQSESKGKALWAYLTSTVTSGTINRKRAELEKELGAVLEGTLGGLKELNSFLDAVEKLAVTSLHVFMEDNKDPDLPQKTSLDLIQLVIKAARQSCPHLLQFKRDDDVFFLPRLQNVEVLLYQLDKYIKTTETLCNMMEKR